MKPSVAVRIGAGIEESTIGLGLDSTDIAGTIVGKLTGITGETAVVLTFSSHFVKRPNAVIVTNAHRDLNSYGTYAVTGWDTTSFTISHNFTGPENPSQVRPLYYYSVVHTK